MAWRGLHISRPARLRIDRGSLEICFRDDEEPSSFRTPLEDLAWLVLDSPEITLSTSFLSRCSETEVLILGVNEKHLPAWASLPWTRFHRQGEVLALQLKCSMPLKKRLWQHIIQLKISGQAACLKLFKAPRHEILAGFAAAVRSGDPDNLEARAAAMYWRFLFPNRNFIRHDDCLPNAMLDYGYSIIRSALARHLCAVGFMPQIGLHHASLTNAYNLADDLIEPYRPFVDAAVVSQLNDRQSTDPLSKEDRRAMVSLLEKPVSINGTSVTLFAAIGLTVASLKIALGTKDPKKLVYPDGFA
jgi:CRISPR-associated protein Cas1